MNRREFIARTAGSVVAAATAGVEVVDPVPGPIPDSVIEALGTVFQEVPGVPVWDAAVNYAPGSIVCLDDLMCRCVTESTGNPGDFTPIPPDREWEDGNRG